MVLHLSEKDFIARSQIGVTPTSSDEVDALRRAARENDFFGLGRADKCAYFPACLFVALRAAFAKPMNSSMNVRVLLLVSTQNHIEHLAWALCTGGVIEVSEGNAIAAAINMQSSLQNRKICTNRIDIEG